MTYLDGADRRFRIIIFTLSVSYHEIGRQMRCFNHGDRVKSNARILIPYRACQVFVVRLEIASTARVLCVGPT